MGYRLWIVAALAQGLRQRSEGRGGALGESLTGLPRAQALGVGERPLELVAHGGIGEIVDVEIVDLADAVGPVGADAKPTHVGDDQERRVLQGEGVLPQLVEGGVQVGAQTLVLPGEAVPLPHIRPAVAAGLPAGALLEAVGVAGRIGLGRRRLVQEPAQVDEVLLRGRALLQLRRPPLGDEVAWFHGMDHAGARRPEPWPPSSDRFAITRIHPLRSLSGADAPASSTHSMVGTASATGARRTASGSRRRAGPTPSRGTRVLRSIGSRS